MVHATDTVLDQAPEAVDGVGMDLAIDVDVSAVVYPMVLIAVDREDGVGWEFVREDHAFRKDTLLDEWDERFGSRIVQFFDDDLSTSFDGADDWRFTGCSSTLNALVTFPLVHVLGLPAHVSFIDLDFARERIAIVVIQHGPNLLEHSPRRLVGDASFALDLLRRDPATCRGHEVDGVEPKTKRGRRLVVDRVGGRMNVIAAEVARVGRPACYPMVLCDLVALLAVNPIGIEMVLEPFQARSVVREHGVEIAD